MTTKQRRIIIFYGNFQNNRHTFYMASFLKRLGERKRLGIWNAELLFTDKGLIRDLIIYYMKLFNITSCPKLTLLYLSLFKRLAKKQKKKKYVINSYYIVALITINWNLLSPQHEN